MSVSPLTAALTSTVTADDIVSRLDRYRLALVEHDNHPSHDTTAPSFDLPIAIPGDVEISAVDIGYWRNLSATTTVEVTEVSVSVTDAGTGATTDVEIRVNGVAATTVQLGTGILTAQATIAAATVAPGDVISVAVTAVNTTAPKNLSVMLAGTTNERGTVSISAVFPGEALADTSPRLYTNLVPARVVNLSSIQVDATTAPGSDLTLDVVVNGAVAVTVTLPGAATTATQGVVIALATGDHVTVQVTDPGTAPAENVSVHIGGSHT